MFSGIKRKGPATNSDDDVESPSKRFCSTDNDHSDAKVGSAGHINVKLSPDEQPVSTDKNREIRD